MTGWVLRWSCRCLNWPLAVLVLAVPAGAALAAEGTADGDPVRLAQATNSGPPTPGEPQGAAQPVAPSLPQEPTQAEGQSASASPCATIGSALSCSPCSMPPAYSWLQAASRGSSENCLYRASRCSCSR